LLPVSHSSRLITLNNTPQNVSFRHCNLAGVTVDINSPSQNKIREYAGRQ